MKLFRRSNSAPQDVPAENPSAQNGMNDAQAIDDVDRLKEVFVYEEVDVPLAPGRPGNPAGNAAGNAAGNPAGNAAGNPAQKGTRSQPLRSPASAAEVEPTTYVESLRVHGGNVQGGYGQGGNALSPRSLPASASARPDIHGQAGQHSNRHPDNNHQGQSSQGYPPMASGNYNGKFITIPYSLLPQQPEIPPSADQSVSEAPAPSRPGSTTPVSATPAPGHPQIDEAVITAVEQQVRNNVVAASQQELKQSRQQLQNIAWAIREADDRQAVLRAAVSKAREVLKADRVIFYRCTAAEQGLVEAESMGSGWTPTLEQYLPLLFFGSENLEDYQKDQVFAFTRSQDADFSPYQHQLMDQYQVKASLALPVVLNDTPWGFLVAHQCGQYRQWRESEIDLIYQVVTEIRLKLQAVEFEHEFQQQVGHGEALVRVIQKIQQAEGVEAIFRTATSAIRQALNCDRAVIYQCNEDWSGQVVAEAVGKGWVSILKEQERDKAFCSYILPDNCSLVNLYPDDEQVIKFENENALLRSTNGGQFNAGVPFRKVDDVYAMGFSDCYIETLEKFQCRAYIHAPIFQDGEFWGILCAYQNSGPRKWTLGEASLMVNLTTPLNTALQQSRTVQKVKEQTEQLFEAAKREQLVNDIVSRIRQSIEVEQVFRTTTQEIRRFLKCDRAVVYRFNEDWTGEFVAESVGARLNSILGQGFSAEMGNCDSLTSLRPDGVPMDSRDVRVAEASQKNGRDYNRSGFFLDDVEAHDLAGDFLDAMERIGARAYLMSGIFVGGKIWGMLAVYHGSPYPWQEADRQLMAQIAEQCGVALQQAKYVEQLKNQTKKLEESAERERSVANLINRIRENQKTEAVFRTATQEVRRLLNCDRTIIYRFNEDWSGEVMAESVGAGWMPLLQLQAQDQSLRNDLMSSDSCVVKYYGGENTEGDLFKQDTYLRETKGGAYTKGASFRQVDDITAMDFAPCYLQTLEKFQCKAYINVPIFQGSKLWGLMAAYQNDAPRLWEEADVNLMMQIAPQLGLTLQQVEYLEKLEQQSKELQASAAREKAANSEMQMKVVELLRAVRPALDGDLTVRAPITEDAVGTVADAYNNTIHALREIVTQVKAVATKVGNTSEESSLAIAQLSDQSQQEKLAIQKALAEILTMRSATDAVATNAGKVEAAVQQANQVVQQGDSAMDRTVDSILSIRSTVSETSKKIKRLSESSQKISRVVSLIGDFTTQTQLLALNAAIEATRAGEYGRGFAVVADEVRSLARQSAEATTEIEKLVQEIQAETGAVTQAMDTGIDQVVQGTNLVNETRNSLTEIVEATAKISDFVQGITDSATTQTAQFKSVAETMNDVTEMATKNSEESLEISDSVKELLATAKDLQSTVDKFKV